jgi:hypothetical protein
MAKRKSAFEEIVEALDAQERAARVAESQQQALAQTLARANRGDPEAIAQLRICLDQNPQVWQRAGDLAAVAESAWIDLLAESNQLVAECIKRRLAQLKRDLAGDDPSAIEKLLIDHLAACYLAAEHAQIQAAAPPGGSLEQASFALRRAESSQKRLLNALKTLTVLRAVVPRGLLPADSLRVHPPARETA